MEDIKELFNISRQIEQGLLDLERETGSNEFISSLKVLAYHNCELTQKLIRAV